MTATQLRIGPSRLKDALLALLVVLPLLGALPVGTFVLVGGLAEAASDDQDLILSVAGLSGLVIGCSLPVVVFLRSWRAGYLLVPAASVIAPGLLPALAGSGLLW
ncbi:hypothetical protein [Kitasatospora sp. NPDC097643]|uniref:hypothetical protein n=1 Tax=Kitasatospora sp. NPDC097643 TaxID=3157230 RepID=UPI00332A6C46